MIQETEASAESIIQETEVSAARSVPQETAASEESTSQETKEDVQQPYALEPAETASETVTPETETETSDASKNTVAKNGFITENKKVYYYKNNQKVVGQELCIDGRWYYFAEKTGEMAVGWTTHHQKRYYYEEDGKMVHGLYVIDNQTYGFDDVTGVQILGEKYLSGAWRYFDEKTGVMATGWTKHHNKEYYYGTDGAMWYGVQTIDGKKYGFDEVKGVKIYGEKYINQAWRYFDEKTGVMATGWTKHHNKEYYYGTDGAMKYGLQTIDGKKYGFDEVTGVKIYGEKYISKAWRYFDEKTGVMATGWTKHHNKEYYYGTDGAMKYGLQTIDSKKYGFDEVTGVKIYGEKYIAKAWRYFDEKTGEMATGWTKHHNKEYYYGKDGAMWYGLQTIDGKKYGFDEVKGVKIYGEKYIAKAWRYFDEKTGVMVTGWVTHHGHKYYYDSNGAMVHGQKTIDGIKYEFNKVTGVLIGKVRVYQNPSQYYQIKSSITLSGGGYNLSVGYEGLKVAYVKRALGLGNAIGLNGALYTQSTANYVKTFQRKHGLSQTGIVNLATWKAMGYSESDWYGLGAYVSPIRVDETSTRSEHIEAMIDRAYDYLGTSYIIGASGAPGTGVDCSGMVMQALYAAGLDISPINPVRHSYPGYEYESANMWASSKFKHVSYSQRKRGDLIFYQNSRGAVIHVAIYLGNNQVIESTCAPFNRVVVQPIQNAYRSNIKGVVRPFV